MLARDFGVAKRLSLIHIYLFDNAGRTVSVRNDAGYGAAWQYLDTAKNKNKLSAATDLRYVSPQYLRGVTGGMAGWTRYSNADHVVVEDSTAAVSYTHLL